MSPFPVAGLRPRKGWLRAHIFRNDRAKVEEGLFWGIGIEFEPFEYEGDLVECSMRADWIVLNIRNWKELEGAIVEGDRDKVRASFYIYEHHEALWTRITVRERDGRNFRVVFEMEVDLYALGTNNRGGVVTISKDVVIPYSGFEIYGGVVAGVPENRDKAIDTAKRHVDLGVYKDPILRHGVYQFEPKL